MAGKVLRVRWFLWSASPHDMWPHYTANKNKDQCTSMKSFDIWLEAWTIYEDLLLDKDPVPYKELSTYRGIIHKANRKYMWSSVYSYDIHFRSNAAIDPNTCFDVLDTALYKTFLYSSPIWKDSTFCQCCKSPDHLVPDCPFRMKYTMEENQSLKKSCTI